jgi:tetratricopeptide (TPR) repeat protein
MAYLLLSFLLMATACATHPAPPPPEAAPFNAEAHLSSASKRALAGQYAPALEEIELVLAHQPGNADAYLAKGGILGMMGLYRDAIDALKQSAHMGNAKARSILNEHRIDWGEQ